MPLVRRLARFVALAFLVPCAVLPAQQAQPATVPLELVQVLVPAFDHGPDFVPDIRVGALPELVQGAVRLPAAARIVGSARFPHTSTSVLALPAPAGGAIREMSEHLENGGWTRAPRMDRIGFLPTMDGGGPIYCAGDGRILSFAAGRTNGSEQYVIIHSSSDAHYPICSPPESAVRPLAADVIPLLDPPEGVVVQTGSSGGGDHTESHVRVQSALGPEALLRHYGAQLTRHGWRGGALLSSTDFAAQRWDWTDADGVLWHGFMTAIARDSRSSDVALRVARVRPSE